MSSSRLELQRFLDRVDAQASPMAVCASCGQTVLTTPDDPMQTLFCDSCLASLEARRSFRSQSIAAQLPPGGLF